MLSLPIPLTIKSLRGFLGLTDYYRKFIKDYGKITGPLTSLLKRNSFIWTATATETLNQLKVAMVEPLVLKLPNFSRPLTIEYDAAGNVTAIKKWRPYLLGQRFVIKSDQQSLKYLLEQRIGTPLQQPWVSKLLGYSFVVEYKSEKENKVTDGLSRRGEDGTMMGVSRPVMSWLDDVQLANKDDPKIQLLMYRFEKGELDLRKYTRHKELLFYKGRFIMGAHSPLHSKVLNHLHESQSGGHSCYCKTLHRVRADFFWQGMRSYVR
ncbi:hypothetical protein HHK36_020320 [Tetracentron sinense]|uniref:Reverse transcriptase/retrotransposon-derived protein RNase H-like domain-containing protein n=1 Tax=Tetracentron sinense TaxID=13715 RepID=A0A834YTU2_TETSI|nr:hypothetical protein HHK36_020320 [Tetracentron sinense]